jgi:hypothetical protein
MKKYNSEEDGDQPFFKGRGTRVYQMLITLKIGETLFVETKDWKGKRQPYYVANRVAKKTGRTFESGKTMDGGGWKFKRLT